MRSIFEIDIDYDSRRDVYFIDKETESDITQRRLEALDTFQALKLGDNTSPMIHFEKRQPQGTENMFGLVHAIKNTLRITFTYQKFWEDQPTHRAAEPYALKEFKNRWYLLAKDHKDKKTKTFGLDRLSDLQITTTKFITPNTFSMESYFQNCFGIITPDDRQPEEVILSFLQPQGKYIKTMPLHESQQILVDSEKEVRVWLKLFTTYDFLLEILSHGDNVKVISPEKLVPQITDIYKNALKQYR
jgi:predicted DNA-binding transcriptional regulator YafY